MDVTANNQRVLIVDDEPDFLALLNVVLVKAGYEVKEACDGEEGYEMAKSFMPALIISDLVMPRLNGEGFLKKIRADKELKEIGFIILSGKGTHESTIRGLLGGADDYIPKPFQKEELLARVKTNIRVSNCLEEIKQKNRLLEEKNREKLKIDFIINDISNLVNESTDGTKRIQNIVQNLKNFAQLDTEEYKMVKINDGLDSTLSVVCYEVTNRID